MHDDDVRALFDPDPADPRRRPPPPTPYGEDPLFGADPRLRHLVLVDGRLVDTWAEPVEGTRWWRHAMRHDEERACRHEFAAVPQPRPYDDVLEWLDGMVGGRVALESLDDVPLTRPPRPPALESDESAAYAAVDELLDRVAVRLFASDPETEAALQHGLRLLWDADRDKVLHPKSPNLVAGGITWAVGRANGMVGGTGAAVTQKDVKRELWMSGSVSSAGAQVQRALRGLRPAYRARPSFCPDLLAMGDAGVLTASTRRTLLHWRDRAVAARDAHAADEVAAGRPGFYHER